MEIYLEGIDARAIEGRGLRRGGWNFLSPYTHNDTFLRNITKKQSSPLVIRLKSG